MNRARVELNWVRVERLESRSEERTGWECERAGCPMENTVNKADSYGRFAAELRGGREDGR